MWPDFLGGIFSGPATGSPAGLPDPEALAGMVPTPPPADFVGPVWDPSAVAPGAVPLPQPRPEAVGSPMSLAPPNPGGAGPAQQSGGGPVDRFAKMLQAISAPKPPEVQKVATPHLQQQRPVQAPKLIDILTLMGLGKAAGRPQPLTLGSAIRS